MPCGVTQDRQVMVERSDRMWSTGEGNGKPLQYSCLENLMNSMRSQNDRILKEELARSVGAQYATGDQWRNNFRNNEGMEPKQKQYPVVDVTGDRSKVQCCKEQYCIGTWNVRSTNQGKLEVVKQETARVNVDILGISELKWTRMGEFNSDDHYIYYCGQESLRRNGVAIIVNKRVQNDSSKALSKHQGVGGGRNSGNFHPLPKNSWNNPPTHQHTKLPSLQRLTTFQGHIHSLWWPTHCLWSALLSESE